MIPKGEGADIFWQFNFPENFCENMVSCMFRSSCLEVQAGDARCLLGPKSCQNCRTCGLAAAERLFTVKFDLWITTTVWVAVQEKRLAGNRGLCFQQRYSLEEENQRRASSIQVLKQLFCLIQNGFTLWSILGSFCSQGFWKVICYTEAVSLISKVNSTSPPRSLLRSVMGTASTKSDDLLPCSPQPAATKLISLQTCQRFQILSYNYVAPPVPSIERVS